MSGIKTAEQKLDDFELALRQAALEELAHTVLNDLPATGSSGNVNMHFHSFFSYNAEGWSPTRIAWESRKAALYAAGLCDFDVLDGLEEFLTAGTILALRTTVNLETRAFFPEYADVEINSPGEPGVTYIMGAGYAYLPETGSPQAQTLEGLRMASRQRNVELVGRINPHLSEIAIDYDADVLPLTPSGNATERHIVRAYINKSRVVFGDEDAVARFWAEILSRPAAELQAMLGQPAFEEAVRARLVKQGGLGYQQPSPKSFPPVDDFVRWVLDCRAIPLITWLDGTSAGEAEAAAMLDCLTAKGCAGLNIIPDRNWNIKDPEERALKIAKLREIVQEAEARGLPINIGTEMNKAGQPLADDLSGSVLSEFRATFLRGAQIYVGHTILLRYADLSYLEYDKPRAQKNEFFAAVGALPPLTRETAAALAAAGHQKALGYIEAAVRRGCWPF